MIPNEQPCKTPFEDLKRDALAHYEEISLKACHWNSFVPEAIKAYNPEATQAFLTWLNEEIVEARHKGEKYIGTYEGFHQNGRLIALMTVEEKFLSLLSNTTDHEPEKK